MPKGKTSKKDHEFFMLACLELALSAREQGNSPVGSVIVKNGDIISRAVEMSQTQMDITFHAEIEAIRSATALLNSQDLTDCTLYTTHEPCIMCSYVIRHSHIRTVVFGVSTKQTGGVHSEYPILLDKHIKKWGDPPEIIKGILEKDCKELSL